MAVKKTGANPFYVLLVIAGIVFTLTATSYGVMTVRGIRHDLSAESAESGRGLMAFLDLHGARLLLGEIGVLAVFTVAAMATDDYWIKRERRESAASPKTLEPAGKPPEGSNSP